MKVSRIEWRRCQIYGVSFALRRRKEERWLTREVVLETGQDVIKRGREGEKDDEGEGSRSIIAETGNILTAGRTWRLNKIPWIIVSRSARTGAINSLAWFQCLNVSLLGPYWVHFASRASSLFSCSFYRGSSFCAPLYARLLKMP